MAAAILELYLNGVRRHFLELAVRRDGHLMRTVVTAFQAGTLKENDPGLRTAGPTYRSQSFRRTPALLNFLLTSLFARDLLYCSLNCGMKRSVHHGQ